MRNASSRSIIILLLFWNIVKHRLHVCQQGQVRSFNPRNEEISASNFTWMGGRGVKPIPCN